VKEREILSRVVSREAIRGFLIQLFAIMMAFLVGAVVLLVTGYNPVDAYAAMFRGAFGDVFRVGQTLTQATPIIFTALAFLFSFKSGLLWVSRSRTSLRRCTSSWPW